MYTQLPRASATELSRVSIFNNWVHNPVITPTVAVLGFHVHVVDGVSHTRNGPPMRCSPLDCEAARHQLLVLRFYSLRFEVHPPDSNEACSRYRPLVPLYGTTTSSTACVTGRRRYISRRVFPEYVIFGRGKWLCVDLFPSSGLTPVCWAPLAATRAAGWRPRPRCAAAGGFLRAPTARAYIPTPRSLNGWVPEVYWCVGCGDSRWILILNSLVRQLNEFLSFAAFVLLLLLLYQ